MALTTENTALGARAKLRSPAVYNRELRAAELAALKSGGRQGFP